MDYVAEAKRHIDFVLCILQWDLHICWITDSVFGGHLWAFSDIFANALTDLERDTIEDYLRSNIDALPNDYQRISAKLLFFGVVKND